MVNRFCFKCGKKTDELENGYCQDCAPVKKVKEKKEKVYELCSKCEYMKVGNEWTLNHKEDVKTKKVVCQTCARKYGDYYEAVLQLRGDFEERHVEFVRKYFNRLEKKADRMAFFFEMGNEKQVDIRVGSKKAAKTLSKMLRDKFGCELKRSYTIHSKKAGRDIVRDTILCRF